MAETVQQLLRERRGDDGVAVTHDGQRWTWREHLGEAEAQAAALIAIADPGRPLHVGVLLGNTPDMLTAMAAAGLGGYVVCGINDTRRGEALLRDVRRADCQILITDDAHLGLLDGLDLTGVRLLVVGSGEWKELVTQAGPLIAAPRGQRHRHLHADLHLGHQRRSEGRQDAARDGAAAPARHWPAATSSPPTTSAICRCRCSTPTRARRLGGGAGLRRGDGARDVLAPPASSTTSAATASRT